jgi:hypothetical protein
MIRVSSIFPYLLLIVVAQWAILPVVWEYQITAVRYIGQQLQDGAIPTNTITLSLTDWKSARIDKKEIRLSGLMYDVRSSKIQGDSIKLVVVRDEKEECLLALGHRFFHQNNQPTTHHSTRLAILQFFNIPFLVPQDLAPHFTIIRDKCSKIKYPLWIEFWGNTCCDTEELPPWVA